VLLHRLLILQWKPEMGHTKPPTELHAARKLDIVVQVVPVHAIFRQNPSLWVICNTLSEISFKWKQIISNKNLQPKLYSKYCIYLIVSRPRLSRPLRYFHVLARLVLLATLLMMFTPLQPPSVHHNPLWRMCTWCWREFNVKREFVRQNVVKERLGVTQGRI